MCVCVYMCVYAGSVRLAGRVLYVVHGPVSKNIKHPPYSLKKRLLAFILDEMAFFLPNTHSLCRLLHVCICTLFF